MSLCIPVTSTALGIGHIIYAPPEHILPLIWMILLFRSPYGYWFNTLSTNASFVPIRKRLILQMLLLLLEIRTISDAFGLVVHCYCCSQYLLTLRTLKINSYPPKIILKNRVCCLSNPNYTKKLIDIGKCTRQTSMNPSKKNCPFRWKVAPPKPYTTNLHSNTNWQLRNIHNLYQLGSWT